MQIFQLRPGVQNAMPAIGICRVSRRRAIGRGRGLGALHETEKWLLGPVIYRDRTRCIGNPYPDHADRRLPGGTDALQRADAPPADSPRSKHVYRERLDAGIKPKFEVLNPHAKSAAGADKYLRNHLMGKPLLFQATEPRDILSGNKCSIA